MTLAELEMELRRHGVQSLSVQRYGARWSVSVMRSDFTSSTTTGEDLATAVTDAVTRAATGHVCAICEQAKPDIIVTADGPLRGERVHARCYSTDDLRPVLAATLRRLGGAR